jgi:signal transduction histidine kinase
MAASLRAKEAAAVAVLTLLVVTTTTLIHLSQLSRVVVQEAAQQADLIARQISAQTQRALGRAPGGASVDVLARDQDLKSLLEASVGFSPHLLYALIADRTGRAIAHSERAKEGAIVPERRRLAELLALDPVHRFGALYEKGRIYEATLPVQLDGQPFGSIRLGVSPALLRRELDASLRRGIAFAGVSLFVALLVALSLARVILRPIRTLRAQVDRLRRGEFELAGSAGGGDEVAELAAQLRQLGQQIQSDRLTMLSERTRLQHVVDHLEDGIIFLNDDGQILFYNRAADLVVGRPLEQAVGRRLGEVFDPAHPLRRLLEPALGARTSFRNSAVALPTAGGPREFLVSLLLVADSDRAMGAMVLLKDLDSIKTLQSLISYSAKLAALGRLTSSVAHEVKNPLNAMMIHMELLREKLRGAAEEVQQSLEVIAAEVYRLDRVVQGFLRFVRPQELSLKPVDLNAVLHEVAALLEAEWRAQGIRFECRLDRPLPPVLADAELIRQVLLNVMLNACQAMPAGGAVRVLTDAGDGEFVSARIIDDGVGIPPADLDKIFRLYYTTKPDGNGIGLSMVYRILQMHDGLIDVASVEGRGTTVTIRLPVWEP